MSTRDIANGKNLILQNGSLFGIMTWEGLATKRLSHPALRLQEREIRFLFCSHQRGHTGVGVRVKVRARGEEKLGKCEFTARQKQTNSGSTELYCINSTKLEMHTVWMSFSRGGDVCWVSHVGQHSTRSPEPNETLKKTCLLEPQQSRGTLSNRTSSSDRHVLYTV